jgi:hypothetical protein
MPPVGSLAATAVLAAGALAAAISLPVAAAATDPLLPGLGYHILTSNGGVQNYGTPWYGSDIASGAKS